jgi:Bacteriophage abortive infection AbiH
VSVSICGRCDHGDIFCAGECAAVSRLESGRRAGARYQRTRRGAQAHAARQQAWRERQFDKGDAEGSAKSPLYAFKKPVEEIIAKNKLHFAALSDISEVVIIGHSLNDVDLPYFREIANYATSCGWVVYCFEKSDWEHNPQQLIHCGVSRERIFTRPYG